jgi:uncharacterized protein (UPF0254 family)
MVGLNVSPQKIYAEEKNVEVVIMMETPFPKSISFAKKIQSTSGYGDAFRHPGYSDQCGS